MNETRVIHNLALVGFMGTGKSSVGRMAAGQLHFEFLDTDELIESEVGCTVGDIFARQGEAAFRRCEDRVVASLASRRDLVISTGGGLIVNPANLASLRTHSLVVCLWASAETIWRRVQDQTHRPLLQAPDPLAKIQELLAARAPMYRQADVLINTDMRSPTEVAQQVIHQFRIAST